MPALIATDHAGHVRWVGRVCDRQTSEIRAEPLDAMPLTLAGFEAEHHAGLTRPACSRVRNVHPKGATIRNTRQLSLVSQEDLDAIAHDLGLDALDPAWLGASVVVAGIPDFSHLPPGARLQADDGTTLTVDLMNGPCQYPAMTIEAARPGHGKRFKPVAEGRRGVTAWVEREGTLRIGDTLRLFVPEQRAWTPGVAQATEVAG